MVSWIHEIKIGIFYTGDGFQDAFFLVLGTAVSLSCAQSLFGLDSSRNVEDDISDRLQIIVSAFLKIASK